jgi:hypothetical protein
MFSSQFKAQSFFLITVIVVFILAHSLFGSSSLGREGMHIKPKGKETFLINGGKMKESFLLNGGKMKEGFTGANTNYGESASYKVGDYSQVNTSNWGSPNLIVRNGQPLTAGVQTILDRPRQPVPLPEGELLMFANTQFTPECCPNVYSNSTGCACMTTNQYNYLQNRGNNNIPYSEY